MATEIIKIVDPGGTGDYTSLAAAIAAEKVARLNLVARDEQLTFQCICTNGAADTGGSAVFDGFVTDNTHFIKITVPTLYRHNGAYQTGNKYRLEPPSGRGFAADINFVWVENLQVDVIGNTSCYDLHSYDGNNPNGWLIARNCIGKGTSQGIGFNIGGPYQGILGNRYIINCLAYDKYEGFRLADWDQDIFIYLYNCNVHNCTYGFRGYNYTGGKNVCKNCIYQRETSGGVGYSYIDTTESSNNISSAADAPGANALNNSAPVFLDVNNDDYRLSPADTIAKSSGINLTNDSVYPFNFDVQNNFRGSIWDRGFSQVTFDQKIQMII
jgi:hypothetical protein